MVQLILSCLSLTVFLVYNIVAVKMFGFPSSLSATFYLFNDYKKNLGYIFTAMMFTMALLLVPAWLELTMVVSAWSHNFQFLAFLAAGSICFVGAAPAFRDCPLESKVHMISAGCAAAFSLLWCVIVCYKLAWILPLMTILVGAAAHLTKTNQSARDYWLEMIAFSTTFATIISGCCLYLL